MLSGAIRQRGALLRRLSRFESEGSSHAGIAQQVERAVEAREVVGSAPTSGTRTKYETCPRGLSDGPPATNGMQTGSIPVEGSNGAFGSR
jgi:hypothetical protein